jgi:hypothetical protein
MRLTLLACLPILALLVQPARADDCGAVQAAFIKLKHTPYHNWVTSPDMPNLMVEEVFTGDRLYEKGGDENWTSSPKSGDELEKEYTDSLVGTSRTCRVTGTETIGGETADIVETTWADRNEPDLTWIGQSSGLVLRMEFSLTIAERHIRTKTVYRFDNISAP